MADEPIRFRNRYTGQIEVEAIYGEPWLRWAYGSSLGRFTLWALAARPWFARWYGWRMSRPATRARIPGFIRQYGIDPGEFVGAPDSFRSFNDFFVRRLRPEARPIDPDPRVVVFPADGRHLGFKDLAGASAFYVKGQRFRLREFLGDDTLFQRFAGGAAVFSRLCPVDYHRFHFPVGGTPGTPRLVNGWLWSVSPVALRRNLDYLWRNKRWHCGIDAGTVGRVLMTEIGATNVGSVSFSFTPGDRVAKGQEKGAFHFGGSAVMTLFEPGRVNLCPDLLEASSEQLELYARVGDVMARVAEPAAAAG
jgi:phosphatidylserine decarboxylase